MGDKPEGNASHVAANAEAQPTGGNSRELRPIDLVLEGGGVKGIALVGALEALNDRIEQDTPRLKYRYTFAKGRAAGTSAGAIVAALLAAGYTPSEIRAIAFGPEISGFTDRSWLSRIPILGKPVDMTVGLLTELGLYKGDRFLEYLRDLLSAKGVRTFKDLIDPERKDDKNPRRKYRAHFVASDITRGRMLVLPDDLEAERYGVEPDDLEVAVAVRMSVSVPFFFRPVVLTGRNGVKSYIVDGGLLSNFPIDIFDYPMREPEPRHSLTLGLRINRVRYTDIERPFKSARALYALASTALQARDVSAVAREIDMLKWARAVQIDTSAVGVLKFGLSQLDKEMLYNEGYTAMQWAVNAFLVSAETAQDETMKALDAVSETRHWVVPRSPLAPPRGLVRGLVGAGRR